MQPGGQLCCLRAALAAVEKQEYAGIHRIQNETGIEVQHILDVAIARDKTHVTFDRCEE